jgi:tRNA A-37 threonylcarbamoyl transferase component Bud32
MALPVTRMINYQALPSQRWKELINHEVSSLATASHPNIRNIIAFEGTDIMCLTLEAITGSSLGDILQRNDLMNDQVLGLCSKVGNIVCVLHGKASLLDIDCQWLATFASVRHHTRQFEL